MYVHKRLLWVIVMRAGWVVEWRILSPSPFLPLPPPLFSILCSSPPSSLLVKDGHTVRQWVWPEQHYKLPVSVAITLSDALSFRCTGVSFAFLYFASGSVNHKISVAPLRDSWTTAGGMDGEEVRVFCMSVA